MNLKDVTLSYPVIQYKVNVSHFTSRNSTAMEWLILEVTRKAMGNSQLEGVPISSIFKHLFLIDDANLMIKPCIIALRDNGALIAENVYDEVDLDTVPLGSLRLTEDGLRMQREGLLPGKTSEDSVTVTYDPIRQKLKPVVGNENYSESATGFPVRDEEALKNETFPAAQVMAYLSDAQKKLHYKWMTQTTQIHEAVPAQENVLWKNTSHRLEVGENWICGIAADEDGSIAAKYLSEMPVESPSAYADAPDIQRLNPDTDIKLLIDVTFLGGFLTSRIRQESMYIIDHGYFTQTAQERWNTTDRKLKRLKAAIIEGSGQISVSLAGSRMTISVPDHLLSDGEIYLSRDAVVKVGRVSLNAGDVKRETVLGYLPTDENSEKLRDAILEIVEKYADAYPQLLYLSFEIGEKEFFLGKVRTIAGKIDVLVNRQSFLDTINRDGLQIYGKKLLTQEQYNDFLLDLDEVKAQANNQEGLERVISEYADLPAVHGNDDLLHIVVRTALESISEPQTVEELWHLWKQLQSVRKSLLQWINNSRLYARFYTQEILDELANRISFTEETSIERYTPVEQAFWNVEEMIRRVLATLTELDLDSDYSRERVLECVLLHKENIASLHSEIRNWEDAVSDFESRVCPIDELEDTSESLQTAIMLMERLRSALSIFFDETALNFQRVYVVDTCALMHKPDLISTFSDGKALLIIPVLVQSELDGKKDDENEETAWQARKAIREIELYRGENWLDNTQNSCPELLINDLDPEKNDNRILSIAIKYIYKNATLITDDINLRNLASSQSVKTMDSDGYMKAKAHEDRDDTGKKRKGKKKKKGR